MYLQLRFCCCLIHEHGMIEYISLCQNYSIQNEVTMVLISNLYFAPCVDWQIMISYLMFGASIRAALKQAIVDQLQLLLRDLPAKAIIPVWVFIVFKSEGGESDWGDKNKWDRQLFVLQLLLLLHTWLQLFTQCYTRYVSNDDTCFNNY